MNTKEKELEMKEMIFPMMQRALYYSRVGGKIHEYDKWATEVYNSPYSDELYEEVQEFISKNSELIKMNLIISNTPLFPTAIKIQEPLEVRCRR